MVTFHENVDGIFLEIFCFSCYSDFFGKTFFLKKLNKFSIQIIGNELIELTFVQKYSGLVDASVSQFINFDKSLIDRLQ